MTQLRRVAIAVLVATVTCLGPGPESSAEIPSFTNDVEPVLTRYGCNSGGCHGKLAGQNGFRLSLRGYAPEADHAALVSEEYGRRVGGLDPATSLLLLKATGGVPHGGGKLFEPDSAAAATLCDCIAGGAPGPARPRPDPDLGAGPSGHAGPSGPGPRRLRPDRVG